MKVTEKTLQLASVLEILENKWAMLILYHLKEVGPQRFKDCQEAHPISSRTLTVCLKKLESAGLIIKQTFKEFPPRTEYSVTEKGLALTPALDEMAEWAKKYLG